MRAPARREQAGRRLDLSKTLVSLDDVPLIDDWLPEFDVNERHDAAVPLEPERALDVALSSPVAPDRTVAALLRARGMPARGQTLEEFFRANDFSHLGRTSTEWAAALDGPSVKIAIDFRAEPIPGGSRLTTETRVKATNEQALRRFRLYWLVTGPFSALIRRRWLKAIQKAARA
jgi:hypothetical protein